MIKLPIFILMWAGMLAIKIPTWLLGFVMVLFLHKYRHKNYDTLPWWTRPWANPEDWEGQSNSGTYSLPDWYIEKHGVGFRQFYQYHAIRNPANGLRSFELLDLDIAPEKVRFITKLEAWPYEPAIIRGMFLKSNWYFAWQGYRAGFKYIRIWNDERHFVMKFGWRVEPRDATDTVDSPDEDSSFATKFLPYRKG